ncbi:MAG: efflux RND transporter permease subunit [Planctomycetes bacterium]|nr:efflux RND transporter permease subunit [Planctomycetota bacterium]
MPTEPNAIRGYYDGLVRRPVALLVIFIALLVVGVISYARIPVQMMPDGLTEPGLGVWCRNAGASAQENEEKVARLLEEQLRTLAGVTEIQSSSREDSVNLWVRFDANTDMTLAKAEVRDRIERARPLLPDTTSEISVNSWSNDSMPIVWFAILHPGDSSRTDFLIDTVVQRRLEAVDGVGNAEVWGVLDDSLRILLDEERVRAANLDLGELISRLSQDNFALPLGEVTDGGRRVMLRSDMRFKSPQEVEAYPIGGGLTIADVGRVLPVKSVRNRLFRIDGSYAFYGEIQKESQANVVETCLRLRAALEELERDPRLEGDFKFLVLFDQGQFITSSLNQLRDAGLWGGGLAVVVLFAFLRRLRSTLAVALSIPFSVLVGVAWIHFGGGSFNVLTMTGITLAMGMLVDNSVVVIENIARLRSEGDDELTAAAHGTREVALAVLLSTLTTIVVFLPMIFMTENPLLRIMFGELGKPLCLTLAFSLVGALVFLPVIAARVVSERRGATARVAQMLAPLASGPARIAAWLSVLVARAAAGLGRVLRTPLLALTRPLTRWKWAVAAALVALALWSFARSIPAWTLQQRLADSYSWSPTLPLESGLQVALDVVAPALALAALLVLLANFARRADQPLLHTAPDSPPWRSLIDVLNAVHGSVMRWSLRHRALATLAALAVIASGAWPREHMAVTPFGEDENTGRINLAVELEDNFTLAQAEPEMAFYERFFEARRAEWGFNHLANRFDARGGRISLYWDEPLTRERHAEVEREIRATLAAPAGHEARLWSDEGASAERSKTMLTFRLVGPDSEELERLSAQAVKILERIPGLEGVKAGDEQAELAQVRVVFDDDIAQGLGISADSALRNIAWSLRGWQLPRYQEEGREIPFLIELDEDKVAGLDTLRDLSVFNGTSAVPLSSFAQFEFGRGERQIQRRNGQVSATIQARVADPLRQKELSDQGYAALKQIDLPRGYSVGEEDLVSTRQEEELSELLAALLLSTVLVYVLMAILFESLVLPVSVMFTVPYAVVGAFWTLYATGTTMDSVGWIGIIILVGVVVNNGIVLIDCIQRMRAEGLARDEAVVVGCARRMRPVMMTAMTTVIGLLPTVLGERARDGIDYRALATCVAGGLAFATVFTLWVVPLAYTVLDDLVGASTRELQALRAAFAPRRAPQPTQSPAS